MKPFLGDQLGRDSEYTDKIDYSPEGLEPRINCWLDVKGLDGTVSYMFVDGAYVRDHVFVDYVEGGHFYRYGWIPEEQIWLEDEMSLIDRMCTGVHETHERYRMKHLGQDYEKAHASACVIERKLRQLLLQKGTIIPTAENVQTIFALEIKGQDCYALAESIFYKEGDKADAASYQGNNSVGHQEF